jgi:hypothetical protein
MKYTLIALLFVSCTKSEVPVPEVKTCGVVTGKDAFANNIDNSIKYYLYWDQGSAMLVTQAEWVAYSQGNSICVDKDGKITK